MRPSFALLFGQRAVLVLLATLLILSALLSTAAVARSGQPIAFFSGTSASPSPSPQPQGQQQPGGQGQTPPPEQDDGQGTSEPEPAALLASYSPPPGPEYKYFHEAGWTYELAHYDVRYFRGEVPYDQHREVLTHLIRSYLTTLARLRLETWLAHGTLLGWWWNGRVMPWDYDLDTQVAGETMAVLAALHNGTVFEYRHRRGAGTAVAESADVGVVKSQDQKNKKKKADDDEERGKEETQKKESDKGDHKPQPQPQSQSQSQSQQQQQQRKQKQDKQQDESEDENENEDEDAYETRLYLLDVNPFWGRLDRDQGQNVIDARWIDVQTGMFVDITALMERDAAGRPGVWSCKNFHDYERAELYPLRETEFEGVPALVPWRYEGILVKEYGEKSLVVTEWEGHRWDADLREWIRIKDTDTVTGTDTNADTNTTAGETHNNTDAADTNTTAGETHINTDAANTNINAETETDSGANTGGKKEEVL